MMHAQPERPVPFQGDLRNLPEALAPLKALPNWVCWRFEWKVRQEGRRLMDQTAVPARQPQAQGEEQRSLDMGHL